MDLLLVLVVLVAVVLVVSAPLLPGRGQARDAATEADRADLEAAREVKFREIRDAELDHRTGKLSEGDWRALDRTLRTEAVEILRRLDELEPATATAARPAEAPDARGETPARAPGAPAPTETPA